MTFEPLFPPSTRLHNVYFGDVPPTLQLAAAYQEFRCEVLGLIEVTQENAHRFGNAGRIDWQPLTSPWVRVTRRYDKQPGTFDLGEQTSRYRNCGRYVLTPEFLRVTESLRGEVAGELDDGPVLQRLVARKKVVGVPLGGKLFDVGNWDGYLAANAYWLREQKRWS